MKKWKLWLWTLLVILLPVALFFISGWIGQLIEIYRSRTFEAWPRALWNATFYPVMGALLGLLLTRFRKDGERRWGAAAFGAGLAAVTLYFAGFTLLRQGRLELPTQLHNMLVGFDSKELFLWGGAYFVQLLRCLRRPAGEVRLRPAGEASALPQSGRVQNAVFMLSVILAPCLILMISARSVQMIAESYQQTMNEGVMNWNILIYILFGAVFGLIPELCRMERNRLRGAVAVTFGLAGIVLTGLLRDSVIYRAGAAFSFLRKLEQPQIYFWSGLYLFLMASLLRQGYREKQEREQADGEEDE